MLIESCLYSTGIAIQVIGTKITRRRRSIKTTTRRFDALIGHMIGTATGDLMLESDPSAQEIAQ